MRDDLDSTARGSPLVSRTSIVLAAVALGIVRARNERYGNRDEWRRTGYAERPRPCDTRPDSST